MDSLPGLEDVCLHIVKVIMLIEVIPTIIFFVFMFLLILLEWLLLFYHWFVLLLLFNILDVLLFGSLSNARGLGLLNIFLSCLLWGCVNRFVLLIQRVTSISFNICLLFECFWIVLGHLSLTCSALATLCWILLVFILMVMVLLLRLISGEVWHDQFDRVLTLNIVFTIYLDFLVDLE